MINEALQNETLDLLKKLIACPSLSGEEQGVAEILRGYLTENGFSTAEIDRYGDLVAGAKGSRPGVRLLFDGHIDTVPADNAGEVLIPADESLTIGQFYKVKVTDAEEFDLYATTRYE